MEAYGGARACAGAVMVRVEWAERGTRRDGSARLLVVGDGAGDAVLGTPGIHRARLLY